MRRTAARGARIENVHEHGHEDARRAVLGLALLLSLASCGCRSHASPEDCAAMTEHYLDLAVRESPGAATMSPAQKAAVREVERGLKRAVPAYRTVQDHCDRVTGAEVSCAKDADGTRAWEACVHPANAR